MALLLLCFKSMIFHDRAQAARLLAKKLMKFQKSHPLVLTIPRGAVPMGKIVADALQCDLDVILVRKIGAPGNAEFAIGAVSEFGDFYLSSAKDDYAISDAHIKAVVDQEMRTIKKRRNAYTAIRKTVPLEGRTVIIVDDGIATGATMVSAVRSARAQKARRVVVAAPVASQEAARLLAGAADETILLDVPEEFWAISQFYEEFPQVTDEQVSRLLSEAAAAA